MSIPPLVCSTPPPPDQCEDDKENDDFDLAYNLSQDDDEANEYDFRAYNTANTHSTVCHGSTILAEESQRTHTIPDITIPNNTKDSPLPNGNNKADEDNNIEDLDLQLEEETATRDVTEQVKEEFDKSNTVTELSPAPSGNDTTESSPSVSSGLGLSFTESNAELDIKQKDDHGEDFIDEDCNSVDNEIVSVISEAKMDCIDSNKGYCTQSYSNVFQNVVTEVKLDAENIISTTILQDTIEDVFQDFNKPQSSNDGDFGDFNDFKFDKQDVSTVKFVEENPWGNEDTTQNFGEFHANFDNSIETTEDRLEDKKEVAPTNVEDDDDFGDFDDFKSSAIEIHSENTIMDVPVLNLHTMDNDSYTENVRKILNSVYGDEIAEPEEKFERMLESSLCETWGHLLDADNRQPYMVTWNNSLGQKTLLRALCIDSRNILFGPKWSHSMPRYAGNLLAAPLQPQRQSSISSTSHESTSDKPRSGDTWTDPFSNTGQEFTYAETLLLDLEHLVATLDQMSHTQSSLNISDLLSHACSSDVGPIAEPNQPQAEEQETNAKKYPTTLNIEPIRQISLPDTHIYTPTDSETPHSQTIHNPYNTILVPQNTATTKETLNSTNEDSEYSEFQDFQGPKINETVIKTNSSGPISYENQILQPVKIESIPTLNWPDPGHVKETFNDFTDFVSNSSWFNANSQEITSDDSAPKINNIDATFESTEHKTIYFETTNGVEDYFNTFQSATDQPISTASTSFNNQTPRTTNDPLNFAIQGMGAINSQISKTPSLSMNKMENQSNSTTFPIDRGILQPVLAASIQPKSTSQILQPLSLESISQINWPSPGIDLQDLSRFNPVDKLHSLKKESGSSKASPVHSSTLEDDDSWGDFVSSKPKQFPSPKKQVSGDEEWSDFVSSPSVRTNGLNTISFNVHTLNFQNYQTKLKVNKQLDIPTLNYVTPKTANFKGHRTKDPHLQNL